MDQGATITVKIPNGIVGYNDGGLDFSNNFEKNYSFWIFIYLKPRGLLFTYSPMKLNYHYLLDIPFALWNLNIIDFYLPKLLYQYLLLFGFNISKL